MTVNSHKDIDIIRTLYSQWLGLAQDESDFLINSAQFCALIKNSLADISWAGFYWYRQEQLLLGSFQGPVACTRIALNKGVCGAAFRENKIQCIADVHQFSDHIACDANAASELVIPIEYSGAVIGVFDIDSYSQARFSAEMGAEMKKLIQSFVEKTEFPKAIFS